MTAGQLRSGVQNRWAAPGPMASTIVARRHTRQLGHDVDKRKGLGNNAI